MGGKRVCVVGSGNWGSAIAKIAGTNAARLSGFESQVNMWVLQEEVGGRRLSDIINTEHENVKYLPGHKLPPNVVAEPDLLKACEGADVLLFVVPHQFIGRVCDQLKGHVKKEAVGMSLIKGVDEGPDGLRLISDIICEKLGIEMTVLMGANLANEVAEEKFCETTIGCKNMSHGQMLKELMQTPNFRVSVVQEADTVEICGALKNVVAVGAGFCDGLGYGDNTKAAGLDNALRDRVGLSGLQAQLLTAGLFQSIEQLEKELLNGQKLQGPPTSAELHRILKSKDVVEKFPLFTAVYQICYEGRPVTDFIKCLQNHPEHM
ncbi:GPDA dehydrogenase, partial [Mionectes macconnelli]|nr:GPDA dehydrogenase [Mionectes macconnelli]